MKKTRLGKILRYYVRRIAYNFKLLRVLKSISREKYDEKISASLVYGFLSAIAVNFFFQPGRVYSSGATGLAQIVSALSDRFLGFTIPVSLSFYAINLPLMIIAWYQIGHSKRPLLQNYYNFTHIDDEKTRDRDLFLAEPGDPESHYSIFEDKHGTHIFANNDLDLMTKLSELVEHGFTHWKLEGIYTPGQNFVEIAKCFVKARELLEAGTFTSDQAFLLDEQIHQLHPKNRFLDTGFYDYDPDMVK